MDSKSDLLYQAEPIQRLDGGNLRDNGPVDLKSEMLGQELLWRGEALSYPDEELIRSLAQPRIDGVVHVNITGSRLLSISDELVAIASESHKITFEWTECESVPISPRMIQMIGARMARWRDDYGVKIAIDDWGSGVDGNARFHAVHDGPDMLKIDGPCFRRALEGDQRLRRMTTDFLSVAQRELPDLVRVVEWVERPEELELARDMGADAAQGFLYQNYRIVIPRGAAGKGRIIT